MVAIWQSKVAVLAVEWQKPEQDFEAVKLALCFSFSSTCESKEIATLFDKSCSSPEDIFEYDRIAAGAVLPSLVRNSQVTGVEIPRGFDMVRPRTVC